jgi:hypothetical protein
MEQRCEVCENFRPSGDLSPERTLVELSFGERSVLLCKGHALIARNSGIDTLEGLRELYRESDGTRSFVPRRSRASEHDNAGRRATDA